MPHSFGFVDKSKLIQLRTLRVFPVEPLKLLIEIFLIAESLSYKCSFPVSKKSTNTPKQNLKYVNFV